MTDPKRPNPDVPPYYVTTDEYVPAETNPDTRTTDDSRATPGGATALPFGPPRNKDEIGTLGKYAILKQIGRGGMGAVFLAYDAKLSRKLAIKVVLPRYADHGDAKERFLREARMTASIKHDHIVTIYEADEWNGVPFIAMEFLQGMHLFDYLRQKKPMGVAQALRVGREIASGLSAAHKRGLIHRDIKPGNVWLEAPNGRVKILDFGLAKPPDDLAERELTERGAVLGTPHYMAPEQAEGLPVDHRVDLFSLGVILYRLLTGRLPFPGDTTMTVLRALATTDPPPVQELNPGVPPALAQLVTELLQKSPSARPASADEVLARLRAVDRPAKPSASSVKESGTNVVFVPIPVAQQEESAFAYLDEEPTVLAEPTNVFEQMQRARRRLRLILAGLAAAAVLTTVFAILPLLSPRKDTSAVNPAESSNKVDPPVVKPKPAVVPDTTPPDRRAAKWALSVGGTVKVNQTLQELKKPQDLPPEDFELTFVKLEGNPKATDAALAVFAGCTNLRELKLESTPVTDAGLAHFRGCKNLLVLGLSETKVTDAALTALKDCTALTVVNLAGTDVTDAALKHFEACPFLREVWLYRTGVTDAGVKSFANCKLLNRVELNDTKVGDAALTTLAGLPALRIVEVKQTNVTTAGVERLKKALPMCRVVGP